MSEDKKTFIQKVAGVVVTVGSVIGAVAGIGGCHSDDVICEAEQLSDSQEVAKKEEESEVTEREDKN
ncbi:MAG: hypothetical protein ACD_39C02124G0003 [uncultured bacterium]|nr:MAG: hypothetical protein ACD_39C02124G0003 [uncultured bacterium]HBS52363.1 hypothetical protein [Coxiellaceae bacterium]